MIDNYDLFTFNLVHYFQSLGHIVKARPKRYAEKRSEKMPVSS